jgi:hypothetical protein
MNTALVSWGVWLLSTAFELYSKVVRVSSDVYRLYNTEHQWFIADNGQFVDSSVITVSDSSQLWYFDGKTIVHMGANSIEKRLPFLSGEFTLKDSVVSMDDFISEVKFSAADTPPFPVIMAAFMIREGQFYPWAAATFKMFLRNGDEQEFFGRSA